MKFDDPREFQRVVSQLLAASEDRKPSEAKDIESDAIKAFTGANWDTEELKPNDRAEIAIVYAYVKVLLPNLLARSPKPQARARQVGGEGIARCVNKIKEYSDQEFNSRGEARQAIIDCLLRGTGYIRHERDPLTGLARSRYQSTLNVFWDAAATTPKNATYLLERFTVYRHEFRSMFGDEAADRVQVGNKENIPGGKGPDGGKEFDRITYYLFWSKIGGRRLYTWVPDYIDGWLTEEDGSPGERWPFVLDDDEWPITSLTLQRTNESVYGFSYYQVCRSPIRFIQWMITYFLRAAKKSCSQKVLYPREIGDLANSLAGSTEHLEWHSYNFDSLGGRTVEDLIKIIEFPDLPQSLIQAQQLAQQIHDRISGVNAMGLLDPTAVETASESIRMSDASENRLADDRAQVEEWLTQAWRKELQINASRVPRHSVVRVSYEGDGEESEDLAFDVPYQIAIQLERKISDFANAKTLLDLHQQSVQQSRFTGDPPIPLSPEIQARQATSINGPMGKMPIPLNARCEIIEQGMESVVGPLAQYWQEGMTPRQIKTELDLSIAQGSTRALAKMQDFQTAENVFKLLGGMCVEWQMWDQLSALIDAIADALDNSTYERLRVTAAEMSARFQQMQQQQMAAQAAQAEQQAAQAAQQQRSKVSMERMKQQHKADLDAQRGERDRQRNELKIASDQINKAAENSFA